MGCSFCSMQRNCIFGSLWLMIYYGVLSYLMFYELANAEILLQRDMNGNVTYVKHTSGFWVLGIVFVLMVLLSLALFSGSIMRRYQFIMVFLIGQIIPMVVELYYLLVALLFGIETEMVFIYLLPVLYLFYIDVVAFIYCRNLKNKKRRESLPLDVEY